MSRCVRSPSWHWAKTAFMPNSLVPVHVPNPCPELPPSRPLGPGADDGLQSCLCPSLVKCGLRLALCCWPCFLPQQAGNAAHLGPQGDPAREGGKGPMHGGKPGVGPTLSLVGQESVRGFIPILPLSLPQLPGPDLPGLLSGKGCGEEACTGSSVGWRHVGWEFQEPGQAGTG